MTEIYFSFSNAKKALSFDVFYRGPIDYAPFEGPWTPPHAAAINDGTGGTRVEKRVNMRRKKEATVLSCQSCQDTLFMARCDLEKQRCK
jgi:hypothetical protein